MQSTNKVTALNNNPNAIVTMYDGQVDRYGMAHGDGVAQLANGSIYQGQWRNGKLENIDFLIDGNGNITENPQQNFTLNYLTIESSQAVKTLVETPHCPYGFRTPLPSSSLKR